MKFDGTNAQFNLHMQRMQKRNATAEEIARKAPDGTALGHLREYAEDLMETDPRLTFAAALSEAILANPRLYDKYLEETGRA